MKNKSLTFTVEHLYELCKKEMQKGNGKKRIYISDDDEGNGFHPLLYSFTSDKGLVEDEIAYTNTQVIDDIDDIIILG